MKNQSLKIAFTICFFALLIFALSKVNCKRCQDCPDCPEPGIVKDTIPGDSVPYPVKVDVPFPVYRDTGSVQWRDRPVDTNAILADYFARYFYADSITDDTSFMAIVLDTVSQNRIISRQFYMQNLRPLAVTTINTYSPQSKSRRIVYAGMELSGNKNELFSFGPELGYKDARDHIYILGNNLLQQQPNIGMQYLVPLRFSRK